MASTKTLGEMKLRGQQLADMVYSSFISDTEWTAMANDAIQQLYDMLIIARGQEYFAEADESLQTVAGKREYPLPLDFYQLCVAYLKRSDGSVHQMNTWENQEFPLLLQMEGGSVSWYDVRYRIRGQNIYLMPAPSETVSIGLLYVPAFKKLTNDNQVFDGINGWEQWAEHTMAIQALLKEESDVAGLMMERDRIAGQINSLAAARDAGRPKRIVDVRRDWAGQDMYFDLDWDM